MSRVRVDRYNDDGPISWIQAYVDDDMKYEGNDEGAAFRAVVQALGHEYDQLEYDDYIDEDEYDLDEDEYDWND